jgi:hypothetical protein
VLRLLLLAVLAVLGSPASGRATGPLVAVAPARTSIYLGTVSISMPPFRREGETYHSTYTTRVFPFFFYNEHGALSIDLPDAELARLAAGETIEFSGRAANSAGEPRRIAGRAVPTSPGEGRIKVRVFVTPRIELIFNTTYAFRDAPAPGL